MALLYIDGFDHLGTTTAVVATKYGSTLNLSIQTSIVRTGTQAMGFSVSSGQVITKVLPASGGAVVGVAFYFGVLGGADNLVEVREGTTIHLAVACSATGILSVLRGATTLATAPTPLVAGNWHCLELQAVIHDVSGSYEVRIDGVAIAALTNAGPVDTRNAGTTGQWDRIALNAVVSSTYFDDLYICDTSGGLRNTFLGPCEVETIYPQTDAVAVGSNAGLTPSTGTDHGALVDEVSPNTTDYNSSPTVGLKDAYNYPALALTGAILGVQTNLYVSKSDGVARQVCAVVRAGGVDYDGANVQPLSTFSFFSEVRAQNPNTSADWTSAQIATLEAGMKVTA